MTYEHKTMGSDGVARTASEHATLAHRQNVEQKLNKIVELLEQMVKELRALRR